MNKAVSKKKSIVTPPELLKKLEMVNTYTSTGNFNQALIYCNNLLLEYPEDPLVLHYVGVLNLQLKQPETAVSYLKRAVKKNPSQAYSYNCLGIALCQVNQIDEAIDVYRKAVKLEPKLHEAYYNLGLALIGKEKFQEAEKNLRLALKANYKTPELLYNLGYLLHQQKRFTEAIENYREALKMYPNYVLCITNLAEALTSLGQFEEALTLYENLTRFYQDDAVFEKMALLYNNLKMQNKALIALDMVKNKQEHTYYLYAVNYWATEQYAKSAAAYKEALKYYPNNLTYLVALIQLLRMLCDWENHEALIQHFFDAVDGEEYLLKFSHYFLFGFSLEQELKFAKKIAAYYENKVIENKKQCNFKFSSRMNKMLRIGYLTANVRSHANAYTITSLFPNHDKENFDITLYSGGKTDNSPVAKELMEIAPRFVDLSVMNAVDAAKKIYEDDIDILVDFTAYNNELTTKILALQPGKIQIGFMGHCGTRGAKFIDYIFLDETVAHRDEEKYYCEKIIYLPDTFFITSDKIKPKEMTRAELNFPEDKILLTCINHVQKYEPRSFDAWMKILKQVPNSVLILWVSEFADAEKNLKHYASQYGMEDRLLFTPTFPKDKHFGRLKVIDLFIDSFECSAQSTAIDALSVGLPIVTLYGNNVASRGASSILKAIGMDELITYSLDEYIEKAVHYAKDNEARMLLREKILRNKETKPLFNSKHYVKKLEEAYLKVKEQYENKVKDHIFIS